MVDTILVFGSSIAQGYWDPAGGWVQRLRTYLDKRSLGKDDSVYVFNLGISGDTSSDIMERMEQEIINRSESKEGTVIIVSAGINDSILVGGKKERVSLREFRKNIEVISLIARRHARKVIFVGLTPVDKRVDPVPWRPEYRYINERVREFNDAVRQFCEESKLGFVEVFDNWVKGDYSKLLDDGLHPNSEGHERIFQAVRDILERKSLV